jgi:murein DD-endopeptidase MepM/ murein hydrolase activator NlpD
VLSFFRFEQEAVPAALPIHCAEAGDIAGASSNVPSTKARFRMNAMTSWCLAAACFAATSAQAQLGGFGCPLDGRPPVRQADAEASDGGRFNSKRGTSGTHGGLDLDSTEGTTVKATLDGKASVADAAWGKMGGTVIIDHGAGAYTVYGHLGSVKVKEGAQVKKGEAIGTVGYTGNASGLKAKGLPPHLHFALIQAGQTGLADKGKALRRMKDWGDMWKRELDAQLTGPVNPGLFMGAADCWTGSTTTGAPGEK